MHPENNLTTMIQAVKRFHEKHNFADNGGHDPHYRMNLIMEEVGEICECLTKGKSKEQLAEEHADLLILLLGNCIALDIDLEKAFWQKYERIMQRQGIKVGNHIRVTEMKDERTNHTNH